MNENYFGDQLRALREEFGYSMQELADILHTTKQVISRYENGQRVPKLTTVSEYASILGVEVTYFMPNPPHWEDDIFTDYINADTDEERMRIISDCGLDPRARSLFLRLRAKDAPDPFKNHTIELTDHEVELVKSYRAHPEMQSAVDTLLAVPQKSTQKKQA